MSEKFLCDDNNLFLDDLSVQNNLFRYIKNSRRRELKNLFLFFAVRMEQYERESSSGLWI